MGSSGTECRCLLKFVSGNDVCEGTPTPLPAECKATWAWNIEDNHRIDIQKCRFGNGENLRCRQIVKDGSESLTIEEGTVLNRSDRSRDVDCDEFCASLKSAFANGCYGIGVAFVGDGRRDDDFPFVFVINVLWLGALEGNFNGITSLCEIEIECCAVADGFKVVSRYRRAHAQQKRRDETRSDVLHV